MNSEITNVINQNSHESIFTKSFHEAFDLGSHFIHTETANDYPPNHNLTH